MNHNKLWIPAITFLPLTLAFVGGAPVTPTIDPDGEVDVRDIVGHAKVDLHAALRAALAAQPGHAVEAGLEGERADDKVDIFYEVMVLTGDGELVEVHVDPGTGKVTEREEAEDDEHEIPGFAAALRHSERSLDELVTAAEAFVKGIVVDASLELEGRTPVAEVKFVNGRHVIESVVEGRAGHLVGLELEDEEVAEEAGEQECEGAREEEEEEAEEVGEREEAGGKEEGEEEEAEEEEEGEEESAHEEHGGGR